LSKGADLLGMPLADALRILEERGVSDVCVTYTSAFAGLPGKPDAPPKPPRPIERVVRVRGGGCEITAARLLDTKLADG